MNVYRVRNLAPGNGPAIEDAAVAVRAGRIMAVGRWVAIARKLQPAKTIDLGAALLTPALLNAHVHLELSDVERPEFTGRFTDWLAGIRQQQLSRGAAEAERQASILRAVQNGVAQCKRYGVVAVGDISQHAKLVRQAVEGSHLSGVSFAEVLGLGGIRNRYEQLLAAALEACQLPPGWKRGLSPHAPYTLDVRDAAAAVSAAREQGLPLASHIGEHAAEELFLREQTGEFRELWEKLGTWGSGSSRFAGGPIEWARATGLINAGAVLAHVNHASREELTLLSGSRATVVYCPRTHDYFGHPPHPLLWMRPLGIRIALGTDSCASSGDLNLLADARLVRRLFPSLSAAEIFRMITIHPARALSLSHDLGTLAPGKRAAWCLFDEARTVDAVLTGESLPQLEVLT